MTDSYSWYSISRSPRAHLFKNDRDASLCKKVPKRMPQNPYRAKCMICSRIISLPENSTAMVYEGDPEQKSDHLNHPKPKKPVKADGMAETALIAKRARKVPDEILADLQK